MSRTAVAASDFMMVLPELFRCESRGKGAHHPTNAYILRRGNQAVVIDPPADLTAKAVASLGISSVTDVLITHVQAEHASGAGNFPDARVHVPAGDEYLCEGPESYAKCMTIWEEPWEWETRGSFKGHLAGARNERPLPTAVKLDESLKPGATIAGLQVISTPGHGKNAITLIGTINNRKVAFCGDLIYARGQLWNWFDLEWDYGNMTGHKSLLDSARSLKQLQPQVLCPTHGPVIDDAIEALDVLIEAVEKVMNPLPTSAEENALIAEVGLINFPEIDSAVPGWRQVSPQIHQFRTGNCSVLISKTGAALVIDNGLCFWEPLPRRVAHHDGQFAAIKKALKIKAIELVIPTHYHGDHTENINRLAQSENARVICIDEVAEVMEHPEKFNLACPLPWYGTDGGTVTVHHRVKSGHKMQWHEFELEFFHLAGQTYFHQGIAVNAVDGKRVVFAGDSLNYSIQPEGILCYNDNEPISRGWVYALDRLIERNPDLVVCGHGMAYVNPMPVMQAKRRHWVTRLRDFKHLSARANLREFFDPFLD